MTDELSGPELTAEQLARAILEQVAEAIVVCDQQGRVVRASKAAQRFCDGSPLQRPFAEAFPVRTAAADSFVLASVLQGETLHDVDVDLDRRGQTHNLILNAGPLFSGPQVLGCVVTLTDITERKRVDEALAQERFLLRALMNNIPDQLYFKDLDSRFTRISKTMAQLFGLSDPDQAVGKTDFDFFTEEHARQALEDERAVILTGQPVTKEERETWTDRSDTWVSTSKAALRDEEGNVVGTLGISRDITARRRSEEALRENEARLRDITFSVGDWVWEVDEYGAYTYSSEKGDDLLRRPHEDIIGRTPFDFMPPDEAKRVAALFSELAAHKAPIKDLENWNIRKNGERVCLLTNGVPILDKAGNLRGYRGVDKDITESKRAESDLRLHSAALNAAANAIVITGVDGTIEWVNSAFTTLTGHGAEEAVGTNLRELVKSGVHTPEFYKHLWDTILAGNVWQGEMTNRRKDGSLYTEEQTVTPVKDDRGEVAHFIAIKRDLTEHHEMEARLRQSQKMETVGQLAGGIAHDFNNLLTVIITTVDLALGELADGDPLHADFREVRRAAERAAGLTRQLLAFSRKQLLQPTVLNLNGVVADMEKMLRRLIGEDIELDFVPAKDLGRVKADLGQFEQVIMNLAVNARDAMPNGGTLTLETGNVELDEAYAAGHPSVQPGPYVMLAVSDTGIGMSEATRQRIFEPFFTTKEVGKGSGLGLSTVYGIAKQSGGSIWAYSEPGKGTTFKIYLPRVQEAAHSIQPAPPVASVQGSETVLLAEDDPGVRHAATRLLQLTGYTVLSASSGAEALSLLERHEGPVHLMLTDMIMPGMGGRELATLLRSVRPQLKVVFTSGYTNDAILQSGLLDETAHFIGKPYTAADLRRKVREVLDS